MDPDITGIIASATELALEDRRRYDPVFKLLEETIVTASAKVSGDTAAALLLDKPVTLSTYNYEIYVSGGFDTAKRITERIYAMTKSPSLALNTDIKHTEFTIEMDGRNLIKIYSQPQHHGKSPVDMIKGITHKGYFADVTLETLPEEIILINYCRLLHNPAKFDQWATAYQYLTQMWDAIKDQFFSRVTGGAVQLTQPTIVEIPGQVIIGDQALVHMGLLQKRNRHLQIITSAPPEHVAEIVSKCVKRPTTVVKHSVSLPGDFQLTKHTVYAIVGDGKQRPVLEMFNSTSYEVVATMTAADGTVVGSHWTILRFLLLDLWLMKLVRSSRDSASGLDRIISIVDGIARSAETVFAEVRKLDPARLFPVDGYVGVNIAENVMRKKYRPKTSAWVPSRQ